MKPSISATLTAMPPIPQVNYNDWILEIVETLDQLTQRKTATRLQELQSMMPEYDDRMFEVNENICDEKK